MTIQQRKFVPIQLADMLDPKTGRTRVRMVNTNTEHYHIARRFMLRLRHDDFRDPHELAKFAATAGLSLEEFRRQFEYLVEDEPDGLVLLHDEPPDSMLRQEAESEASARRQQDDTPSD